MPELVREIMKNRVVSVEPIISVQQAAEMMERENVSCIVITEDTSPTGILTERDFVRRIVARDRSLTTPVKDVMSSPLLTIGPDEYIWTLIQLMKRNGIHKVPVVKKDLIGIVTTTDIVNFTHHHTTSADVKKAFQETLLRIKPAKSLTVK